MGSAITNNVNIQNQITNDFLQESMQSCSATCSASANNNTIIVAGNVGNITIEAICSASASCVMTNSADATVTNVISNQISQSATAVTDFMGDLSFNSITNNTN